MADIEHNVQDWTVTEDGDYYRIIPGDNPTQYIFIFRTETLWAKLPLSDADRHKMIKNLSRFD